MSGVGYAGSRCLWDGMRRLKLFKDVAYHTLGDKFRGGWPRNSVRYPALRLNPPKCRSAYFGLLRIPANRSGVCHDAPQFAARRFAAYRAQLSGATSNGDRSLPSPDGDSAIGVYVRSGVL